jgi:hypothetical protein
VRPLEPGTPQRRVRALDSPRKGSLHRRREQDEDFHDLFEEALDGRDTPGEPAEEDPVSWQEDAAPAPGTDGLDRVEIQSLAAPPAAAPENPADPLDTPSGEPRPNPTGGDRPRLDLKA